MREWQGGGPQSRHANPLDCPQEQIGGAAANLLRREDLYIALQVGESVKLIVRDVLNGHEGYAVAPADLSDGGGLHVFAE